MELKQVILVRTDLKMPKGKMAAQVAHASVDAVLKSSPSKVDAWRRMGMKKIVVKVVDEKELMEYQNKAKSEKLVAAVITDAGRTVVAPGTKTCMAIGPDEEEKVDKVTSNLKLMS